MPIPDVYRDIWHELSPDDRRRAQELWGFDPEAGPGMVPTPGETPMEELPPEKVQPSISGFASILGGIGGIAAPLGAARAVTAGVPEIPMRSDTKEKLGPKAGKTPPGHRGEEGLAPVPLTTEESVKVKRSGYGGAGGMSDTIKRLKNIKTGHKDLDDKILGHIGELESIASESADVRELAALKRVASAERTEQELVEQNRQYNEQLEASMEKGREATRRLESTIQEHRDAEIDPMRYFKTNRGWAIAGALMGALGQYLTARTGRAAGENLGLKAIENAIERDIDAQVAEINKLGRQVNIENNLVALYQQQTGSLEQGKSMARVELLDGLERTIAKINEQEKGSLSALQGDETMANLNIAKTEHLQKVHRDAADMEMKKLQATGRLEYQRGMLGLKRSQVAIARKAAMSKAAGPSVWGMHLVRPELADKKSVENLRKVTVTAKEVIDNLQTGISMRRTHGAKIMPGEVKSKMQTAGKNAFLMMKIAMEMGAHFTDAEQQMIRDLGFVDPTELGWDVVDRLESAKNMMYSKIKTHANMAGYELDEASWGYQGSAEAPVFGE